MCVVVTDGQGGIKIAPNAVRTNQVRATSCVRAHIAPNAMRTNQQVHVFSGMRAQTKIQSYYSSNLFVVEYRKGLWT